MTDEIEDLHTHRRPRRTSLFGGTRTGKDDPRITSYGTVDELNSWIGLVRASWPAGSIDGDFEQIQNDLFEIGAHLASPAGSDRFASVSPARIEALEKRIDTMDTRLAPLKNFILPGGSMATAHLHIARTVCRRAERLVVALGDSADDHHTIPISPSSDFLFVAAGSRIAIRGGGCEWKRSWPMVRKSAGSLPAGRGQLARRDASGEPPALRPSSLPRRRLLGVLVRRPP